MSRIGIKFCGGCNPLINRSRIWKELNRRLPGECSIIRDENGEKWKTGIMLCGCPVACVDREEVRSRADDWILVGGPSVDLLPVSEDKIVDRLVDKCRSMTDSEPERPGEASTE
jgi:hypothetical protein